MGSSNTHQGASGLAVVCRAGTRMCALPVEHVVLTMRPVPAEPVAQMPSFVRGVAVVRGAPIPVIDAARLLGDTGEAGPRARYVVCQVGARRAALSVDAVVGVEKLTSETPGDLPPLLGEMNRELVREMSTRDTALLFVLESARLVPEALWAALETRGRRA